MTKPTPKEYKMLMILKARVAVQQLQELLDESDVEQQAALIDNERKLTAMLDQLKAEAASNNEL